MPDESKTLLERVAALSALYGVVATAFYVFLRIAYVQFYARAGIDPEDVGIGRAELLSQAIAGPLIVIAGFGMYLLALYVVTARPWRSPNPGRSLFVATCWASAASLLYTLVLLFWSANNLADDLENGDAARLSYIPIPFVNVPILEIWALPMRLEWPDKGKQPEILSSGTDCMLYLGDHDGVAVVYDVKTQSAIRFKREDATVITSREPELLDRNCLPDSRR